MSSLFGSVLLAARVRVFFFFQAEDGIRDTSVTGVQTCALPILIKVGGVYERLDYDTPTGSLTRNDWGISGTVPLGPGELFAFYGMANDGSGTSRSEERRVGKECRSRKSAYCLNKESQDTTMECR